MTDLRWTVVVALGLSVGVGAQGGGTVQVRTQHERQELETQARESLRMAVQSKIVRDAPYSAEKVTEFVQSLADGNRIVRRTVTRVFRDSEGRTRVEQTDPGGGIANINISDPVAGETLVLYPESRTAYRGGVFVFTEKLGGVGGGVVGGVGGGVVQSSGAVVTFTPNPAGGVVRVDEKGTQAEAARKLEKELQARMTAEAQAVYVKEGAGKGQITTTREDLGQQMVEGVLANGTRTTTVIEPGAIGNELPIRIVSEEWHSPDLQMLVLTKHSDPRSGDTTFRLTHISRAEPDRALFTLPPDYTLKESAIRRLSR